MVINWKKFTDFTKIYKFTNLQILQISFTQIFFFICFDKYLCYPCRLRKAYAVLRVGNRFVGSEVPKYNVFNLVEENFKNLNSI